MAKRITIFRLYTEYKNISGITKLADSDFESYTMYRANGRWQGIGEKSLIIEIIAQDRELPGMTTRVFDLARRIKKLSKQQAVWVTSNRAHGALI